LPRSTFARSAAVSRPAVPHRLLLLTPARGVPLRSRTEGGKEGAHRRREGGGVRVICAVPHHITSHTHTHTWSSLPHTRSRRAATATTPRGPAASACCAAGPCARRGVLPPSDPNLQPARGRAPRRQGDLHLRVLHAPRHAGRRRRAAPPTRPTPPRLRPSLLTPSPPGPLFPRHFSPDAQKRWRVPPGEAREMSRDEPR